MNYINDKVSYNLSGLNQFEGKTEEIDEILTCMNLIVTWDYIVQAPNDYKEICKKIDEMKKLAMEIMELHDNGF